MTDRDDQSNLPPIPDGGLAESMPDWLRRPPAWRTLMDREITVPGPEESSDLPEPDDSVIDPRTFLSDDDLPAWLRNLGPGRSAIPAAERDAAATPTDEARVATADTGQPVPVRAGGSIADSNPPRFVPTSPHVPAAGAATGDRRSATPPRSRMESAPAPAWHGAWVVAILAGLLVVAIAVIAVLVL